ncbi:MAG TPA: PP2C family protein-serine/threonine phosphatase [Planctomycetota bacterium]|nr:PP2C family protein-serine/threonine phosphatase [Planctomycetota bacterium]
MVDALHAEPVVADAHLELHLPRSLTALRDLAAGLFTRLLRGAPFAMLVDDRDDGLVSVELAHGEGCPLRTGTRVPADAWRAADLQRAPLRYRGQTIGHLVACCADDLAALPGLGAALDHYAAAVANLKLDEAALSMVDHYCASLQAFEEGVVLFQEKDHEVTAARLLRLVASLLRSNHAALLSFACIGDPTSRLTVDHVLGVPDHLVLGMRAADGWWPLRRIGDPPALLHRGDPGFPEMTEEGRAVTSVVTCPLHYHGVEAGLVLVFNVEVDDADRDRKLATLRTLGELGAALLHRLQLEREAVLAKELETQLAVAAAVQARLLPHGAPSSPRWDYAFCSRPSRSVGGDYVDLFGVPDGGIYAVLADVSGHGLHAALLMVSTRAHFRAAATAMPAAALARLNASVAQEVGASGMFVTCAALRLAPHGRTLHFASAGHNPVLLCRARDREVLALTASGPPLGFAPDCPCTDVEVALAPGDVVVLYSDGITEATAPGGDEMFGEERLRAALVAAVGGDARAVVDHVLATVEAFTGRASSFDDDASLIVIRAL